MVFSQGCVTAAYENNTFFHVAGEFSAAMCFQMWAFWVMAAFRLAGGNKHRKKEPPISHLESGSEWENVNYPNQWRICCCF